MDNIIELLKSGQTPPLPRTQRRIQTSAGSVIIYTTGTAHRRLSGRASKGTLEDKFFVRVTKTPTCWLWTGSTDPDGYGRFYLGKADGQPTNMFAHRWAYQRFVGPIPDGYVIDHIAEKCTHRNCVNPEHLEPTSSGDNVSRGWKAKRDKKTQCVNLHDLSVVGLNIQNHCNQCARDAAKKWRERHLEEARKAHREGEARRRAENRDTYNANRRQARAAKKAQSSS